jgi:N-acetylmuramic acid 6-phosphate etherase
MRSEARHSVTEGINPRTIHLDRFSTLEIIQKILEEDRKVAGAVARQKKNIAKAVDLIVSRLSNGGRLFFVGAGTSGRLGAMEAAECPPTFGTQPGLIQSIIAGGKKALWQSIEGAEDSRSEAQKSLSKQGLVKKDIVVGIAASGATPFVQGALSYAKKMGSARVLITCNRVNSQLADITICLIVGPEVISGSTRMKAGTATKMVLNMLTTASMVRLGKTYGNLMVGVQPKSKKLKNRAIRIVMKILGTENKKALELLRKSNWDVKASLLMGIKNLNYKEAKLRIAKRKGYLGKALKIKRLN